MVKKPQIVLETEMSAEFSNLFFCNSRMLTESHCGLVITHFRNLISKRVACSQQSRLYTLWNQSRHLHFQAHTHTLYRSLSEAAQSKTYWKLPVHLWVCQEENDQCGLAVQMIGKNSI